MSATTLRRARHGTGYTTGDDRFTVTPRPTGDGFTVTDHHQPAGEPVTVTTVAAAQRHIDAVRAPELDAARAALSARANRAGGVMNLLPPPAAEEW